VGPAAFSSPRKASARRVGELVDAGHVLGDAPVRQVLNVALEGRTSPATPDSRGRRPLPSRPVLAEQPDLAVGIPAECGSIGPGRDSARMEKAAQSGSPGRRAESSARSSGDRRSSRRGTGSRDGRPGRRRSSSDRRSSSRRARRRGRVFPGDLHRPVRAEAVDDDDFGGEAGQALQRGGYVPLLVAGDDHRRDLHAGAPVGLCFPQTMASRAIRTKRPYSIWRK